jgi:hypothetical protein
VSGHFAAEPPFFMVFSGNRAYFISAKKNTHFATASTYNNYFGIVGFFIFFMGKRGDFMG